jgi:hypothetical protein
MERNGGFGLPIDVDRSFEWMVGSLIDGISASRRS